MYSLDMESHSMIIVKSFMKIVAGVQKLLVRVHMQTHKNTRTDDNVIHKPIFFHQNKDSRPNINTRMLHVLPHVRLTQLL